MPYAIIQKLSGPRTDVKLCIECAHCIRRYEKLLPQIIGVSFSKVSISYLCDNTGDVIDGQRVAVSVSRGDETLCGREGTYWQSTMVKNIDRSDPLGNFKKEKQYSDHWTRVEDRLPSEGILCVVRSNIGYLGWNHKTMGTEQVAMAYYSSEREKWVYADIPRPLPFFPYYWKEWKEPVL